MSIPTPASGPVLSPINRESPIPLHVQCRDYLHGLIERGELRPGQTLERERELAARWGVSLAPVRQAILDLVREGYLHRVRGRGTFVSSGKVVEKIAILGSFTENMRAKGLDARVAVLRQECTRPVAEISDALGTGRGELIAIERLATVEGQPVAVLNAYLPAKAFPGLEQIDLEGRSLYETLRQRYDTTPQRAESVIEVIRCGPEEASLLRVERGMPALRVEGTTFDQRERPIEFSRVIYRADRFRFALESYRGSEGVVHVIEGAQRARRRQSARRRGPR
jgi:DNA-binding GntR family transcriptional regulator